MITPRSPNDNVQNMCSNSSTFWDALSSDKPTYLVGGDWNIAFMTFHILGIIMPTDVHFFQRVETTNQFTCPCSCLRMLQNLFLPLAMY